MAHWEKTLTRMARRGSASGYTYREAAAVLSGLGLKLARSTGTSHRTWRGVGRDGLPFYVGLVDHGSGTLKPYLIRDMISTLRQHGIIAPEEEVADVDNGTET